MIKNIGVDIVEISRFEKFVLEEKSINRFLSILEIEKFNEISNIKRKQEYMASRFACKEALIKASGISFTFNEVSILNDEKGAPYIESKIDFGKVFISISHSNENAVAFVVIEI